MASVSLSDISEAESAIELRLDGISSLFGRAAKPEDWLLPPDIGDAAPSAGSILFYTVRRILKNTVKVKWSLDEAWLKLNFEPMKTLNRDIECISWINECEG